jgi:hypothetical protein
MKRGAAKLRWGGGGGDAHRPVLSDYEPKRTVVYSVRARSAAKVH